MHTSTAIRGTLSIVSFAAILLLLSSSLHGQTKDKDGKIEERNGRIVQINLGRAQGVQKGDMLDVYRLTPAVQFLGVIQIVEAFERSAVGDVVQGDFKSMRAGDMVARRLPKIVNQSLKR